MNKTQDLVEWLDKLRASDKMIIVEGIKDKAALVNLGIQKERIFTLNKPIFAVAEEVASISEKIILLTDLDSEGKKLYSSLKQNLAKLGVEIDNYFREYLFRHSKISHIEGLDTYFSNQELS